MMNERAVPVGYEETAPACPACGQPHSLIALGVRYANPHRWRRWVTVPVALALCTHCDALIDGIPPRRARAAG